MIAIVIGLVVIMIAGGIGAYFLLSSKTSATPPASSPGATPPASSGAASSPPPGDAPAPAPPPYVEDKLAGCAADPIVWYKTKNPDIANADINPWWHYMNNGKAEGRLACFDDAAYAKCSESPANWYNTKYPDIAAANVNPWAHYMSNGKGERRFSCFSDAEWNSCKADPDAWYLAKNPDVAKAATPISKILKTAGRTHYTNNGKAEGRLSCF